MDFRPDFVQDFQGLKHFCQSYFRIKKSVKIKMVNKKSRRFRAGIFADV